MSGNHIGVFASPGIFPTIRSLCNKIVASFKIQVALL